ncbi:MAG: hypothetical protein ABIP79_08355, partial [Chitinophagaceae bacterium]
MTTTFSKCLLGICMLCVFFISQSCKNDDKKVPATNEAKTPETESADFVWNGDFPYLGLPKKTIDSLFDIAKSKKIVFTFQFDSASSTPSLVVYGIKAKKYLDKKDPQYKLLKSSLAQNIAGEFYLGDLELTNPQYIILKNDPTYGTSNFSIFSPFVSPINKKSIVYNV